MGGVGVRYEMKNGEIVCTCIYIKAFLELKEN